MTNDVMLFEMSDFVSQHRQQLRYRMVADQGVVQCDSFVRTEPGKESICLRGTAGTVDDQEFSKREALARGEFHHLISQSAVGNGA